tara:strand:+ start:176 stop:451 length:276 start_codon:yes stop_codon:yes gene_type:complete
MHQERIQEVITRLQSLEPTHLDVIDESHLHIGHPGAQTGMSHIRIKIASKQLEGLSKLMQHKKIYHILGSLMKTDLHAVAIEIIPVNFEQT